MRTDVKVGLICLFAVALAVIIYFVAQGNHPVRAANNDATHVTPATSTRDSVVTRTDPTPALSTTAPSAELRLAARPRRRRPHYPSRSQLWQHRHPPLAALQPTPSMTSTTMPSGTPSIIRTPGSSSDPACSFAPVHP